MATIRNTLRAYGYDPGAARALLDRFGYKDRDGDGYRELPDGRPLTVVLASTTDAASRARDELWKRSMDAIGIRITFLKNKWTELNKMSEAGQLMMWGLGWISSIPDGNDYYSYFYSRNIGTSNDARMRLPAFDALFEESLALPDGAPRTALFDRMNDLIFDYAPWILTDYPYSNVVAQPWLRGYKQQPLPAAPVVVLRRRAALTRVGLQRLGRMTGLGARFWASGSAAAIDPPRIAASRLSSPSANVLSQKTGWK